MFDFAGDDIFSGDAGDGAAQVGQDEVMEGTVPPAHTGADGFLLDVLRECCTFLLHFGVKLRGSGGTFWVGRSMSTYS